MTASGKTYWLVTSAGETVQVDGAAIQKMIRTRKATPADQAAVEEGVFVPLGSLPEFAPLFAGFTLPVGRECVNHPGRPALHACPQCHRRFCADCAAASHAGGKTLSVCPACRGLLQATDRRLFEKHWWQEPETALLYPFQGMAWATSLGIGFLMWFGQLLIPFSLPIYFIGLAFILHIIGSVSRGARSMDTGPDISDITNLVGRGAAAFLITVLIAIPFVVLNLWAVARLMMGGGSLGMFLWNLPLAALAFAYYPMALGVVAVWDNAWLCFRPDLVIGAISKIPREYLILVFGLFIITVMDIAVTLACRFIPLFGGLVAGLVSGYFVVARAYMLGRVLYMNEEPLGWS
jgi:hypothetical protein